MYIHNIHISVQIKLHLLANEYGHDVNKLQKNVLYKFNTPLFSRIFICLYILPNYLPLC